MAAFDITPHPRRDGVVVCQDPFCLARIEGGNLFLAAVAEPGADQWRLVTDADAQHLEDEYGDLTSELLHALWCLPC